MTLSQHVQTAAAVQHVLVMKWEWGKVIYNTAAELNVVFPLSLKTLKPLRRWVIPYKHLNRSLPAPEFRKCAKVEVAVLGFPS